MAVSKIDRIMIMEAIKDREKNRELHNDSKVIRTGFDDIDYLMGGLRRGQTYLLGARPSMGKTAFAFNIINYVAINERKRVLYFSLDSSKKRVVRRFTGFISKTSADFANDMAIDVLNQLENAITDIEKSEIYIDDTPNISIDEIATSCCSIESEGKDLDLIIIDYLQLISADENDRVRACVSLSEIAKKLNCAVLILSQISRDVEDREDHRPMLGDLIESEIKRTVDNILFLYRDEYYDRESKHKGLADICVAKSMDGDRGTIALAYSSEYQRFCNIIKG